MSFDFLSAAPRHPVGMLAFAYSGKCLPLTVLCSGAGHYIGTFESGPCSRESVEYFATEEAASDALQNGAWTQRLAP